MDSTVAISLCEVFMKDVESMLSHLRISSMSISPSLKSSS